METEIKSEPTDLPWIKAVLATIIATLGVVSSGAMFGYSTMAIPSVNATKPFLVGDPTQFIIWLTSLPFLGAIPAGFVSFTLQDMIGRKKCIILGSVVSSVSWLMVVIAKNVWMMYTGAFVNGFAAILLIPAVSVYVAEISPEKKRPILMSTIEMAINTGILLTYIVGSFVRWNYLALVIMLFVVVSSLLMLFVPETPRWLLFKKRRHDAERSMHWLFGQISPELTERILTQIDASLDIIYQPTPWRDFFHKPLLRNNLITQLLYFLQIACGFYTIRSYLNEILSSVNSKMNYNMQVIIYAVIAFVSSMFCSSIVNRFSRRLLLMISMVIMALSTCMLAAYYRVIINKPSVTQQLSWMPLVALVCSTFGYLIGIGPLPYIVSAELFPTRARSRAIVMAFVPFFTYIFINVQCFQYFSMGLGSDGFFFLSSAFSIIGLVLIYFFVPETKDRVFI